MSGSVKRHHKHMLQGMNRPGHPVRNAYYSMRRRCLSSSYHARHRYKDRGIVMCERWLLSIVNFVIDMGPSWERGLSLDRIDNDGPYTYQNCRWSTMKEQVRNANRFVFTEEEKYWISQAYTQGITQTEIANCLGCTQASVSLLLTRMRRSNSDLADL